MSVGAMLVAQVMIGAGTIWLTFPQEFRALHLGAGTAVWGGIAVLTLLIFTLNPTFGNPSPGNPKPDTKKAPPDEEPANA